MAEPENKTPPAEEPTKAVKANADPAPIMISFREFVAGTPVALANALRVSLGLSTSDLGKQFNEADLKEALAALEG